jgi:hypothetical protein
MHEMATTLYGAALIGLALVVILIQSDRRR